MPATIDLLTPSQRRAVTARGNVLVMAGAGTGKTKTLIARCLDCLARERASLDELLVVTFTEAAAAELRQRLRLELERKSAAEPEDEHWPRQLALFDIAHIGTLHGFCRKLIREHFYELGLDPQLAMLDEGEARQRAGETLDEQFEVHYAGIDDYSLAVQNLVQIHGGGRDEIIRRLVLQLHHYSQTRPDAAGWLTAQIHTFSMQEPGDWQRWLPEAIQEWRDEWLPVLENLKNGNVKAAELAGLLQHLKKSPTREIAAKVLEQIIAANSTTSYPSGKAGKLRKPLGDIFEEAKFLAVLATVKNGPDPLAEDWGWVRGHMQTLLRLAQEFDGKYSERKRSDGVLDFQDLEQFALKLLWDFAADRPTAVAGAWREKLQFIFVDEYQDINAAQDKIISALSRDGGSANRFLVGDVKQSIYRFRLADPKIFRNYDLAWRGPAGETISLTENFRSRESLLGLVNSVFGLLMRREIGGVHYDAGAELKAGRRWNEAPDEPGQRETTRTAKPEIRAELLLRLKAGRDEMRDGEFADLDETQREARLLALRLRELKNSGHELIQDDDRKVLRPAEWRDMAVLFRAPAGKSEIYAIEFERAGVPLLVTRGGFYDSREVADLLSLLQLLDNPLQDVSCIAVLRSPLGGCSLDELAEIRLAANGHFWFALNQAQNPKSGLQAGTRAKVGRFLERFARWRKLARQSSLSNCLETVLAETCYADWLRAQPRGAQRYANIERFRHLAEKFDQFQRQGLYRFLKFIEAQRDAGAEPDAAEEPGENAVRLMSIHQSKGLEFPVVAVADLAKRFNTQDLHGEIIFDDTFGLCPKVKPPGKNGRYPSLPHWRAQRHQRRELAGEELRLLYVAMTRAREHLILTGSVTKAQWEERWQEAGGITTQEIVTAKSYADWLGLWFAHQPGASSATQGELPNLRWRLVDDSELGTKRGTAPDGPVSADKQGGLQEYSPHPLETLDEATAEKLIQTLNRPYPHHAATERVAKSSVTALRREAVEPDEEAAPFFPARPVFTPGNRQSEIKNRKLSAADAGTAHHKFLQFVSLSHAGDPAALAAEAGRLERENILSADERQVLDLPAIGSFWTSTEGRAIRDQSANVARELAFTARFSPQELAQITGTGYSPESEKEFIVVQGVADLVVLLPKEIWLADFKTDDISPDDLGLKVELYRPQIILYARALARIYSRPVTNAWLHFLSARRTVAIDCAS